MVRGTIGLFGRLIRSFFCFFTRTGNDKGVDLDEIFASVDKDG